MLLFADYLGLFVFFVFCFGLSCVIFGLSILLSAKADDVQKLSAYECGFNPFDDTRTEFDVKFYIVAILFIIFDLEISFLFPFITSFNHVATSGTVSMLAFLIILTVGFVYEWQKGALDWT